MGAYGGPGACEWGPVERARSCMGGTDPEAPIISVPPQPQRGCPGSTALFSVAGKTTAVPLRYQWFQGIDSLSGQIGPALSLTDLNTNAAGPYSVIVSNAVAGIRSTALLSMYEACVDLHVDGDNRMVSISGPAGTTYVLKYTTHIANMNFASWTPLATNTMGATAWLYNDMVSPLEPRRFYGVGVVR